MNIYHQPKQCHPHTFEVQSKGFAIFNSPQSKSCRLSEIYKIYELSYVWLNLMKIRERCKKKQGKKLTSVSFAFTHTYTPVKTNMFPFFPQAYMENFENVQNAKNKQKIFYPMLPVVVSFPPSNFQCSKPLL